jgi:hypothetical protein
MTFQKGADLQPNKGMVIRNAVISSAGGLLNGVLSAIMLALAAHRGMTDEIAAYTVMTAVLSIFSILVGGGAILMYTSGTRQERSAIRSQWVFFVGPLQILAALGVGALYAGRGYSMNALLLSGLVFVLNNFSQLQWADLTRVERFVASALLMSGTKAVGLIAMFFGTSLVLALAASAAAQFVASEIVIRYGRNDRRRRLDRLSIADGMKAYAINRHLFGLTVADLYSSRMASVVLSFIVTPHVMGLFGAIITAFQALTAVLYIGIRAPMAARIRARLDGTDRADLRTERAIVLVGFLMGISLGVFAPIISTGVLGLPGTEPIVWLRVLAIALPFLAFNRVVMFARVGDGAYGPASRVAWLTAGIATIAMIAVPISGPMGAAAVTPIAEALTVAVLFVAPSVLRASGRKSAGSDSSFWLVKGN